MLPISRRGLLAGASALAAFPASAAAPRIRLRLIETSDLHMFVADHDYYRDRPDLTVGLTRVATLIARARAEATNTLLVDNGDIIQGNPLGDYMASPGRFPAGGVHPIFRAMNTLNYDAATVGNHEFNYGLDFLARCLDGARFPFVCANVLRANGSQFLPPHIVLTRRLRAEDGAEHTLKIGVIGFVTPQIMQWDRSHLAGRIAAGDIVDAAAAALPALRAQCDVIVGLSHSGISTAARASGQENASLQLAGVPGFDAIFTGHSHRVFPGPDYRTDAGVDATAGTLAGVPAVMPGFWGSHLGVIDLTLEHDGTRWRTAAHSAEARPIYRREAGKVVPLVEAERAITEEIRAEHEATRVWVAQPVGTVSAAVSSRFAFVGDTSVMDLINAGQLWYARDLLAGTPHAGLPLLSAAAPFKSGFTPDGYVDLPAGPLAVRDLAEVYLFANTLSVVRVSGAVIKGWLEHSAEIFNRIDPAAAGPQELINRRFPGYNFDLIAGLELAFDVTRPIGDRVRDLRFAGQPIDPAQIFAVVTNNYRADGGGNVAGLDGSSTVLRAPDLNRDALIRYVETNRSVAVTRLSPWRFAAIGRPVSVTFDTAPEATEAPAGLPARRTGLTPAGFARFQLELA